MKPHIMFFTKCGNLCKWIYTSGVRGSRGTNDNKRDIAGFFVCFNDFFQFCRIHLEMGVCRNSANPAVRDSDDTQSFCDGAVCLIRNISCSQMEIDICQLIVPGGSQSGDVCHRPSAYKDTSGILGKSDLFCQPF